MKNLDQRRKEAKQRQIEHNNLDPKQRLIRLDLRLGGQSGAKKERERLFILQQQFSQTSTELKVNDKLELEKKKSYQKPKRS